MNFLTRESGIWGSVAGSPGSHNTFPKGSISVSSQLSWSSVASTLPARPSLHAAFPPRSKGAISMLQGSCRRGSSSPWLPAGAQPGDTLAAPGAPRSCPACLRVLRHGKGHAGHFSYDLTLARAVSHRKPGPSGAEPQLAKLMERPPGPLGPV